MSRSYKIVGKWKLYDHHFLIFYRSFPTSRSWNVVQDRWKVHDRHFWYFIDHFRNQDRTMSYKVHEKCTIVIFDILLIVAEVKIVQFQKVYDHHFWITIHLGSFRGFDFDAIFIKAKRISWLSGWLLFLFSHRCIFVYTRIFINKSYLSLVPNCKLISMVRYGQSSKWTVWLGYPNGWKWTVDEIGW